MGKNFSGNTNPARYKSDFYQTPYNLTRRLLEVEKFGGSILEPACGNGAIVSVLKEFGYQDIKFYDILTSGKDFLEESGKFDCIITNPPFSLAKEFILKALEISDKFAFLLPLNYLHGKERHDEIYARKALQKVYVFTRYPMLSSEIRSDGKYQTGMMVYVWYVFSRHFSGQPEIYWLDNNEDVLKKGER
ncbi:hypothetical protein [Campylobacter curvus]|uniref:hypothetical protein n=1 Tax=Campylobacter curvus TaxID=200 RepID=UPI001470248F|nr:hypothetical protein [Campylobacter curvus]